MSDDKLERIERMVDDIHQRLFIGNGRPSLMTLVDRHDQQLSGLRWILGVMVIAVIGVIARLWAS